MGRRQVPVSEGGTLTSLQELLSLGWTLARRDPSAALTSGMQTWSQLVWMVGTPRQRSRTAQCLESNGRLCLAVSEREHGADLLGNEMSATPTDTGWMLQGEKWPIGHAGNAQLAIVLARTGRGAGGLTTFLVDRDRHRGIGTLPRVDTLGLRASELSGLTLDDVAVTDAAHLGEPGQGLRNILRLFQITRPLVAALGIGMADTVLRLATRFAIDRRLYGRSAAAMPTVQDALLTAWADLLAAEILAVSTVRGLHTHPEEACVTSLIAKVRVPLSTGRALETAARVLGARHYIRDGAFGIVQMMLRDHRALPLFDGSTDVCLASLVPQLPTLLTGPTTPYRPETRVDVGRALPPFDPTRLGMTARGQDAMVQGMAALPGERPAQVSEHREALRTALDTTRSDPPEVKTVRRVDIARGYARLHHAAAVIQFARGGSTALDASLLEALLLPRILHPDRPLLPALTADQRKRAWKALTHAVVEDEPLSAWTVPEAG